jgi:Adenine-specific methyltransferase EcoRI
LARAPSSAASNSSLHAAKAAKNDEFYTQISDIEKELRHYKDHLKGKVIFCNCDDPEWSNFWLHFTLKFEDYGLAKVVATHYAQGEPSYKLEFTGKDQPVVRTPLQGDGDFRSDECVEILKSADVVITNPPFSLFREYIAQLVEHDKKFLIIGSQNAVSYKETFQLIQTNQLWLGITKPKAFVQPDGSVKVFGNIGWFTNLAHNRRNEELLLFSTYAGNEQSYPRYANHQAIEVAQVTEIPADYEGAMGVPITFLDKYNPDQFEILGSSRTLGLPISQVAPKGSYSPGGPRFYLQNTDGSFRRLYDRIVIRKRTQ